MGLEFTLTQRLALECSACGQYIDADEARDTGLEATLCGESFYARCPTCGQLAPEGVSESSKFRRRWLAAFLERVVRRYGEPGLWVVARHLKVSGGYVPFARCRWRRAACEFISYPTVENGRLIVLAREVDKPWTMERLPLEEIVPWDTSQRPILAGLFDGGRPPTRVDVRTGTVTTIDGEA